MKIDIKKRYSFSRYDDLIEYMIENNYDLEHGELWHIFNNMRATKSIRYNKLGCAIIYLLDELKGEKRERLVVLLNKSFEYKKLFNGLYAYKCNNPLVDKYLTELEKLLRKKFPESQQALEEFQRLF
ncbi:MAG: hypothetical protein E7379_04230 [Clostridiales bacterium]|nr:hypothetical protein [Clostridiales bacterium]